MSNFSEAIANGMRAVNEIAGTLVRYERGEDWTLVDATPGKTDLQSDSGNGVILDYQSRDYIIERCQLLINDEAILPVRGDLIKETVGNQTMTYEVLSPAGGGEQPWRYSDVGRFFIRIHTKLKEVVDN